MKPLFILLAATLIAARSHTAIAQPAMDGSTAVQAFSGHKFAGKTPSGKTLVTLTLVAGKVQQDGSIAFTGDFKAEAAVPGGINDSDALTTAVFYPQENILRIETRGARSNLVWNGQAFTGLIKYGPTNFFYTLRKQ